MSVKPTPGDLDPTMRRRAASARVARLATIRPNGHPHVVPITFALEGDLVVTAIDHKPKTTPDLQRLRNITAHPRVCVLIDYYDDEWSRLWWVRGDGRARIVGEGADYKRACELLEEKYAPYRERSIGGPVIVVEVERWGSWSASGR